MKNIEYTVHRLRQKYIDEGLATNEYEINCGMCVDFAEDILGEIRLAEALSNDNFIKERESKDGWDGDETDSWDEEWLKAYNSLPAPSVP